MEDFLRYKDNTLPLFCLPLSLLPLQECIALFSPWMLTHPLVSVFRLAQAGSVNVSTVHISRGVAVALFLRLWFTNTVCVGGWAVQWPPYLCVRVCSALGALRGPNRETEEQTHDSWGGQGPVGQNLWFHRCHQADHHSRSARTRVDRGSLSSREKTFSTSRFAKWAIKTRKPREVRALTCLRFGLGTIFLFF